MTSQFAEMMSSSILIFVDVVLCLVKFSLWSKFNVSIITVSVVMAIFFIGIDQKSGNRKQPPSEFCQKSGNWNELGLPDLARMSLIKCY